jgi:hypothetical protein
MKYIITEEQHKKIMEYDKLVPLVQRAVDNQIDMLREQNEVENNSLMQEMLDSIKKITVDKIKVRGDIGFIYMTVDFVYAAEYTFGSLYFTYIKPRLKELFGIEFILQYKENLVDSKNEEI